jgi:hypothetical protein
VAVESVNLRLHGRHGTGRTRQHGERGEHEASDRLHA